MYINHKVILKDESNDNHDCFFCKLCKFPLSSFLDFKYSKEYDGACNECYLTFIEARRKEWKEGWRPDKETLETHIYTRKQTILGEKNEF